MRLQPVISICFLDGILFCDDDRYHLRFRLLEQETKLSFTDHLELHLFQLANFVKTAEELAEPLDAWLYFLNNGRSLDPDNLPASLKRGEIKEAVGVLKMLTQDEIRRAMYEDREKARRDAASWQSALERWKHEADQLRQEADRAKQEADRAKQQVAASHAQGELIGQIHAYQHVLGQQQTPEDHLTSMSLDELKSLVDQLRSQLNGDEQA